MLPFRCASRTSFERPLFQKPVQIIQQKLSFWQSRSEQSLLLKSRILKIVQVLLLLLEDRKRLFGASFDSKLTSPRRGSFRTLAKCFVLYHLGDHSGPKGPFLDFTSFLIPFFVLFLFFHFLSLFTSSAKVSPSLR